jgi:hypothetical protein
VARALILAKGDPREAAQIVLREGGTARVIGVLKEAQSAGATADGNWAAPLTEYGPVAAAFASSLRHIGIFDAIRADARPGALNLPFVVITGTVVGHAVGETLMKPVGRASTANDKVAARKALALVCLSDEALRAAPEEAVGLLLAELQAATISGTDELFLTEIVADATPIPSAGVTADAVREDLGAMLEVVKPAPTSHLLLVVAPRAARKLALMTNALGAAEFPGMSPTGGTIANVPVRTSDHAGERAVLVDADGLIVADEPILLSTSSEATLNMATDPAEGAGEVVSLFQTNTTALLAERRFGWRAMRTCAAVVEGVAWGGTGQSPG